IPEVRLFRRGQRLEIDRNCFAIGRIQLLCVSDDLDHGPTDAIGIGRHTAFERLDEILNFPVAKLALGDVGDATLPCRTLPASKSSADDDGAEYIARRMTFGTVAGAVDKISAAIPLRGLRGIRCESFAVKKQ